MRSTCSRRRSRRARWSGRPRCARWRSSTSSSRGGGGPRGGGLEITAEPEPVRRGLYGGTIGYFGAQGDMDQAITIRTLVFRGDEYSYQAGAGLVADSNPASEYDEVVAKSGAMARALKLASEGL